MHRAPQSAGIENLQRGARPFKRCGHGSGICLCVVSSAKHSTVVAKARQLVYIHCASLQHTPAFQGDKNQKRCEQQDNFDA
jgi:hypothetical protein